MNVPFVDLRAQHRLIADEVEPAVARIMKRGWFTLGDELEAFEAEFAAYCRAPHAVGVGSGTEALHLALKACGIGPGDEVITVSHTFIATALAVTWTGATPVFVDVDPATLTMDPERVADAITHKTRAILPVHLYGACADMEAIMAIASERDLWVVEDAAQAHGARLNGRMAGSIGHAGCFSFYPTKNLGAYGDAGAVVTNDERLADRVRRLRNYGQSEKYHHDEVGYNSRLDEMQAAVLRVKLRHLDDWNRRRREIAVTYSASLGEHDVRLQAVPAGSEHVYHLYVVQLEDREHLRTSLERNGVQTLIHYPIPVHLQKAMEKVDMRAERLPVTERCAREVLSLPIGPEMSDDQVRHVCRSFVEQLKPAESV